MGTRRSWIDSAVAQRRLVLVGGHAILAAAAYLLAFLVRFDFAIPEYHWDWFLYTLPILLLFRLTVFAHYHFYDNLWSYVGLKDVLAITKAVVVGSFLFLATVLLFLGHGYPRGVFVLDLVFCGGMLTTARVAVRALQNRGTQGERALQKRAVIVGAGHTGEQLAIEIERNEELSYTVVGFADDDPRKQGGRIQGVKVLGTIEQLPDICREHEIDEILIAIPSATREDRMLIARACRLSQVVVRTVPKLTKLLTGSASITQLDKISPEDLIGRDAVQLDRNLLERELRGKRILVTGAGGSIGSALCHELAALHPEALILFERAESSLFFAEFRLNMRHPDLKVIPILGDILNRDKLDRVIREHRPEVIYHTAAYKHVPIAEVHPLEAIENNVLGTETLARAAIEGKVEKFVSISTDKAVNPVGVMGMTKRIGERILMGMDSPTTTFVVVRFGNVLGSDGSVIPLFQMQIDNGGPVTVTDPEASRYFMLPSEAAQLVLQAGAMGEGREIFFLNMGEPIRILDLAESMIRLSGYEPGMDMPIELVGLRPGERLHETLCTQVERLSMSTHEKIFRVQNGHGDHASFKREYERLRQLVADADADGAVECLKSIVEND
jgi:FlaA1/EpsC-like NDP-sugar epimerase